MPDSPVLALHRLFRLLHQRNRYVSREPSVNLSISEAHILTELDAKDNITQKQMSMLLRLPQSTLASTCAQLIEQGLLSSQAGSQDKRKVVYSLTKRGREVVVESDNITDQNFNQFAAQLKNSEKRELIEFFSAIADGYGEEKGLLRPGESRFRLEQRRITRAFGLLTEHAFGGPLTGAEWQIINEIACKSGEIVGHIIENRLCIARGTLAAALKRLESRNLIERRPAGKDDRREKMLFITEEGLKVRSSIEEKAVRDLAEALKPYKTSKLRIWVSVLARYTLEELNGNPGTEYLWYLQTARSKEERAEARAFLIQHAVKERKILELPESIAAGSMLTVLEFYKGKLFAVYDFFKEKEGLKLSMSASHGKTNFERVKIWLMRSVEGERVRSVV